ncbi:MAG: glycosyltransferase family 2 protein [Candidatus Berkelbacteria bacterium]|nr:glycosyltransferase family 2 protein [Candidatus Berkelbacteria bacterium]
MLEKITIVTVILTDPISQFRDFLDSLRKIEKYDFDLILVNNSRKIGWLKSETRDFPRVTIINIGRNIGFCAGSNLGIRKALENGSSHVMLLNGDTTVSPNVLADLLKYQKNTSAKITSPIILSAKNKKIVFYAGGIINRFWGYVRNRNFGKKYLPKKFKSGKVDFANGCCMLIRREVFEKIGFLDEDLFIYFDDPDFSLRAQHAGFETHILAEPLISHIKTSNSLNAFSAYLYARNPFILIRKNFPWYFRPSAYLGQFLIRLPRNLFRCQNLSAVKSYFLGLWHGIISKIDNIF